MDSAASAGFEQAVPATRRRWRLPRHDRPEPAHGARRPARGVPYRTAGAFGCSLVAETAEASTAYGADLVRRARHLDQKILRLAHEDSSARRVLGHLAGRFIEGRGWERLGFARLGDYGAERLGWSGRQLQEVARVATALAQLPRIENAFQCGTLGWSKARLLACVASASDETRWLAVAAATDARTLAAVTSSARAAAREQRRMAAAQPVSANCTNSQGSPSDHAIAVHSDCSDHAKTTPETTEEEDEEERVLVRVLCSRRTRYMWNEARRYAPRMAGRALAQWEVAELVAAEASSAPGPFHDLWQQEPWRCFASTEACGAQARVRPSGDVTKDPSPHSPNSLTSQGGPTSASEPASPLSRNLPASRRSPASAHDPVHDPASSDKLVSEFADFTSPFESELARLENLDAFELDAAMRRVRRAMQQRQSRFGLALGQFLDLRLHTVFGYDCSADYVRERLGIPDRTARELVRVAQAAQSRSPVLASAYARGELSWLRTLTLLPVVRPWNAAAWVQRAGEITLRRLTDEVAWAAGRADLEPGFSATMPPAPDQDLGLATADDRQMCARDRLVDQTTGHCAHDDRQMCAQGRAADQATDVPRDEFWGVTGRIHVTFVAPLSVSVLFRTIMQGFAAPTEPRSKALERMLEHVLGQWRSQPRHRDPVFARDGHRCSAPACSSLTNLHDHHIIPRSVGGTDELGNRTTLCAWHHLRAVHGGLARATGKAPDAIDWELGLVAGKPPLLRLRGERYLREQT